MLRKLKEFWMFDFCRRCHHRCHCDEDKHECMGIKCVCPGCGCPKPKRIFQKIKTVIKGFWNYLTVNDRFRPKL